MKKRLSNQVLKSEKRIVSGVEKLDIMRFIMEIFASFSPEIEFLLAYFLFF
ncbi:hypothetical protein [Streptococcus mitis]|uniref:hypothetical protein n=1 Tax=Streptococcus mitis TaxID=28037 RepID=UPI00398C08A4